MVFGCGKSPYFGIRDFHDPFVAWKADIWRSKSAQRCGFNGSSQHFNRASSSIFPLLAQFGGIRSPDCRRSRFALSVVEREEISRRLVAKRSLRSTAQSLNRSPSTISREVYRNGGRQAYRAARSDQRVWLGATRLKPCKLSFNDPLCQLIARKLRKIKGVIPASERLPEVDDRAVPAIGKGDLIGG